METPRFTATYTHNRKNYYLILQHFAKSWGKVFISMIAVVMLFSAIQLFWGLGINLNANYCIILSVGPIAIFYRYNKWYQNSLEVSKGLTWTGKIRLSQSGFSMEHPFRDTASEFSYEDFIDVFRIQHLVIFLMKENKFTALDLTTLNGGTREELLGFLQEKCPSLQGKPVRRKRSVLWAHWVILICSIFCLVYSTFQLPVSYPKNMTVEEAAVVLEDLGITGISQEHLDSVLEFQEEFDLPPEGDWIPSILFYASYYSVDEDLNMTPAANGVYCFDMEAWEVGYMYTSFLYGLRTASCGELQFEDIEEDDTHVNWEEGSGYKTISFTFQGERYTVKAQMMTDWYDGDALAEIVDIVNRSGGEKRLWFLFDGGQMISVFYQDAAWAKEFRRATGYALSQDIASLFIAY